MAERRQIHEKKTRAKQSTGFDRVVVPLDGSEFAERALPYAERLARTGAEVIVVRAVASASQLAASAGTAPLPNMVDFVQISEDGRREAQTYLDTVATRLERGGMRSRLVLVAGAAPDAIARVAEESHAEVIVMTTHGRGGLERVVFGGVADAVVRSASRPVLLVPLRQDDRMPTLRSEDAS